MFSYFDGSLEDYLHYIKDVKDNRLVKIKLCPATKMENLGIDDSFHHVIDNFAVTHIVTKHSNEKETLRGQIIVEEIRNGRHELAGVTYFKRKRKLTGANS